MQSLKSDSYMTFQGQEVWMQANGCIDGVVMGTMGVHGFNKAEDVRQLKWPAVTHLASNWQPTSLACGVSHNNQF